MIIELVYFGAGAVVGAIATRVIAYYEQRNGSNFKVKYHEVSSLDGLRWRASMLKQWLRDVADTLDAIDDNTLVLVEYRYKVGGYSSGQQRRWVRLKCQLGNLLKIDCLEDGSYIDWVRLYAVEIIEPAAHTLTDADRKVIEELQQLEDPHAHPTLQRSRASRGRTREQA